MEFNEKNRVGLGSIVLVDLSKMYEGDKLRPCVVVSKPRVMNHNTESGHFMVVPLHSVHDEKVMTFHTHVPLRMSDERGVGGKMLVKNGNEEYKYFAVERMLSIQGKHIIKNLGWVHRYSITYQAQISRVIKTMLL